MRVLACLLLLFCANAAAYDTSDKASVFSGTNLQDGKPLKLSKLRGRVVYVDFWASWCAPCRQSMPLLEQMSKDLGPQGLTIVGVNVDEDEAEARRTMQAAGITYPVLHDPSVANDYEVQDMPSAYLVDRQGRVRAVHRGFRSSQWAGRRAEIEKLLKEKK